MSQVNIIISKIMDVVDQIRSPEILDKAAMAGIKKMDEVKNRETRRGRSPVRSNGIWNNRYNKEYAKKRKGGKRSPVTLRDGNRRIEDTNKTVKSGVGTLTFTDQQAGRIFKIHDDGAYGKIRQIYPRNNDQLPDDVRQAIINTIRREVKRRG